MWNINDIGCNVGCMINPKISNKLSTRGARLRFARENRGMSQEKLAEEVGCSQGTVYKLENNKLDEGSIFLPAICRFLNVDLNWVDLGTGIPPLFAQANISVYQIPEGHIPVFPVWDYVDDWIILTREEFVSKHGNDLKERKIKTLLISGEDALSSKAYISPVLEEKQYIVDPLAKAVEQDHVIIKQAGSVSLYEHVTKGSVVYLRPLNSQFPAVILDESHKFLGVVLADISWRQRKKL
jgi:transcriptional regulator with XRE-family HTH domain